LEKFRIISGIRIFLKNSGFTGKGRLRGKLTEKRDEPNLLWTDQMDNGHFVMDSENFRGQGDMSIYVKS
jgi:hypothetical protein